MKKLEKSELTFGEYLLFLDDVVEPAEVNSVIGRFQVNKRGYGCLIIHFPSDYFFEQGLLALINPTIQHEPVLSARHSAGGVLL